MNARLGDSKDFRKLTIYLASLIFFISCSTESISDIKPNSRKDLNETRLGETKYYINLPKNLIIEEVQGKEGTLNYDISPVDSSSEMFGVITLEKGNPIGTDSSKGSLSSKKTSNFLNHSVTWKIYKTEGGFYEAYTPETNITASASSNKLSDIDSLISIIATLTKK